MSLKFNIDRPKISDEEIKQHQDFKVLVERFKQQSLKQAQGDESWRKNKKVRYSTIIAGVTVVCTITYLSFFNNQTKFQKANETLTTKTNTSQNTQAKAFVTAPSSKLKTAYSAYTINNAKGGNIVHSTSTKIKVPKNSFVDQEGKDIVGDVTLEYREFHDLADVITSGIPMAYDSAGTKYNLESAGMFDIRGSQNGQPVFIKPEKKLEVELASHNDEQRFNQYYLDTVARNWKYLRKDKATPVKTKQQPTVTVAPVLDNDPKLRTLKREIEVVIPKKIDSVQVVYTTRAQQLPRPKEPVKPVKTTPGKATFKLDGSYNEFPELAAFDNVLFEVGPENRNYSRELHDVTWSDVKIGQGPVKGKNYLLTLSYRSRVEKLIVYPVLSGTDFDKAQTAYEQKLESYQQLASKRQQEEQKLIAEMQSKQAAYLAEQKKRQEQYDKEKAAMLAKYNVLEQNDLASNFNTMSLQVKANRIFQVSQFGIFNSDCPHPSVQGTSVALSFVLNSQKIGDPELIYLVDHTNKTVYMLDRSKGFRMNYVPDNTYSICIFNKRKMYICSKEDFRQTVEQGSKDFTVRQLPENADNLVDFKKAIGIEL